MSHLKINISHVLENPDSDDFELRVNVDLPNKVTAVFGESGAGKTTLLRAVAGLEKASQANVSLGDQIWQDEKTFLPTHKRQLSYVFQRAGLFPHLSVAENIDYGVRRAVNPVRDQQAIFELLNISALLDRMPDKLSGGEQQRVSIARAMMRQPRLLLLDEPLASLDQARKDEVLPYLEALCANLEIPALYVSHSLDEISRLASHIVVLRGGQVIAHGDLSQVLNETEVVNSLGFDHSMILDAQVEEVDSQWGLLKARFPGGYLELRNDHLKAHDRFKLRLNARDVSIALSAHTDSSILNVLPATVSALLPGPDLSSNLVQLELNDSGASIPGDSSTITALITKKSASLLKLKPKQQVWAQIKSVAVVR